MTPRAFLVRGLLAGLFAGMVTFCVAYVVGEPQVEEAIALEQTGALGGHSHSATEAEPADSAHSHVGDDVVVTRAQQRTWGLLTGTLAIGTALGGLVSLFAAWAMGRLGTMSPGQSTASVAAIGFVSFALVPWLKYPATPPAVGSGDTIDERTTLFFGFVLVSVITAVLATAAAAWLAGRLGVFRAMLLGILGYLLAMVLAAHTFDTVNELGAFPADVLWYFRRASLISLATMWGVLGFALTGLVLRMHSRHRQEHERRALALSL